MPYESGQIKESGTIDFKVESDVVSHLSIGLYRNFPRAIKELVSNAYDSGATEVRIGLDFANRKIIVRDNGKGMNKEELRKFVYIGRTTEPADIPELNRKRIGTFGIGVLSVFPYCENMRVFTKKENTKEMIELVINTKQFFRGPKFELVQAKATYNVYDSDLPYEASETIIVLEKAANHILSELQSMRGGTSSIEKLGGFQKFRWYLGQYCPISFPKDRKDLKEFFEAPRRVPMKLWLEGEELFRNVPEDSHVLECGEKAFGNVKFRYAIMSPMKTVRPEEARGLQIRLRDVAVGLPRDFDVIKLTGKVLGKLNWLCGEVQILQGLDLALMIDRDDFFFTEEVAQLNQFFREKLTKWNDELEEIALKDKELYEYAERLGKPTGLIQQFKETGLIQLSEKQLRIPKKTQIVKKKGDKVGSLSDKILETLTKRTEYRVARKRGVSRFPIRVDRKKKEILVYEDHPDLEETTQVNHQKFEVRYEKWNYKETPSICRLRNGTVEYNVTHPIFRSKLNNDIIKRLSLGLLLILEGTEDGMKLLQKIEHLLEDVFFKQ
jgi:hypothetical protein